jgi:hypothetical protein
MDAPVALPPVVLRGVANLANESVMRAGLLWPDACNW